MDDLLNSLNSYSKFNRSLANLRVRRFSGSFEPVFDSFSGVIDLIIKGGRKMSSSTISQVTVPEGMSCVNAFYALWENSDAITCLDSFPALKTIHATSISTAEKVARLFRMRTRFEFEGGKLINTDFSKFPQLDIYQYDKDFGPGAARRALEQYSRVPSCQRFDKNDFYKFEELKRSRL